MILTHCPNDQTLRNYVIGDCHDGFAEEIEQHLANCPACEETIAQLDSVGDTLMRSLPMAGVKTVSSIEKSPHWLDRLRNGPPLAKNSETHESGELPAATPSEGLANYELLGTLGKGGMGIVYLARHKQLNRLVALKVLSPRALAAPEARRRFLREIHMLGSLNHPGIVMATDAGTVASGAYLVMELIDGADLARIVREGGPLTVAEACEVARQMALALAAAHESGAIHRDVKPSNVMIDRQEGRGRLLDFGLARLGLSLQEGGETSVGRLLGTLDYMSPEQVGGAQSVDQRTDLYGLGATLFFLLTGRPPHGSHAERSLLEYLRIISGEPAPRVSSLRADVPEELDDFIARLLSLDKEQRPSSAMDAARELSRWAGGDLAARAAEIPSRRIAIEEDTQGIAAAQHSLSELLGLTSSSPTRREPASISGMQISGDRPRRRWPWLVVSGAAAMAALFGITILLETPEGTLRIESEVDNVQVELVDDQSHSQELRIEPGQTEKETRLRAGAYRIILSGQHDGLSIDKETVTLRRGEETVAKITRNLTKRPGDDVLHAVMAVLNAVKISSNLTGKQELEMSSSTWAPPVNPDPQQIRNEAEADRMARRYADALAKQVWFFQHAEEYQPSQSGVRLSFALSEWLKLGQVYPPAMEKLRQLRDQAETDVIAKPLRDDRRRAFQDLNAINRTLEEEQRTVEMFLKLDQNEPELASVVYSAAQPSLIKVKRYDVCGKYLDSQESLRRLKILYDSRFRRERKDSRFADELRQADEKWFIDTAAILVALLKINGRNEEAEKIAHAVREIDDSPKLKESLEKALNGTYLPPAEKATPKSPEQLYQGGSEADGVAGGWYTGALAPRPGDSMKHRQFVDMTGQPRTIGDLQGQYVFIHAEANWCAPCIRNLPKIKAAEERLMGKPITFIELDIDKNRAAAKDLGISVLPTYFLIDPEGRLITASIDWSEIKNKIDAAFPLSTMPLPR